MLRRGWVGLMAVGIKWLDLLGAELALGGVLGLLWGALLATFYSWNRKRKEERTQLVRALGALAWCSCTSAEQAGALAGAGERARGLRRPVWHASRPACRPTTSPHASRVRCLHRLASSSPAQLATIPGAKGMQELLHNIPSWISFRDTEKMEVGAGGALWVLGALVGAANEVLRALRALPHAGAGGAAK